MTGLYALEVGSALSYVTAVLVPALDALVPVLPSETVVIALGVATAGTAKRSRPAGPGRPLTAARPS